MACCRIRWVVEMDNDKTRKPGRAPGRFVASKVIAETPRATVPVANTPIKRFDRTDTIERDLERYRADARARLLRNGFDIPPYLMPKPKPAEDEDGNPVEFESEDVRDIRSGVMAGPKPAPLANEKNASIANVRGAPHPGAAKPSRHVHVKGGQAQMLHHAAQQPHSAHAGSELRDDVVGQSAYQDYLDSLHGGPTLLDHMRSDEAPVRGRVDDLKTAATTTSRIDLPDNSANWVSRDGHSPHPLNRPRPPKRQPRSKRKSRKGSAINWNKVLPKFAAYMIAAVCVGYVLVLTLNQFNAILHK